MFSKTSFLFVATLAAAQVNAQSDASVAASVSGISVATGTLIGGAIGTGSALTVGAVAMTASAAYLTVVSTGTAASEAAEYTLEIPLAIAARLARRAGERIDAIKDENGTRLQCGEDFVAYIPAVERTGTSGRKAL
jgi:hypothetical protein